MTNLYFIRGAQSKIMKNVNDNEIIKTINEIQWCASTTVSHNWLDHWHDHLWIPLAGHFLSFSKYFAKFRKNLFTIVCHESMI